VAVEDEEDKLNLASIRIKQQASTESGIGKAIKVGK
jgi:hypothetical protein